MANIPVQKTKTELLQNNNDTIHYNNNKAITGDILNGLLGNIIYNMRDISTKIEFSSTDMNGISLTLPQDNQILQYSGGTWINAAIPAADGLYNIIPTGVTINVGVNKQYFVYDDLTIKGEMNNSGDLVIFDGNLVLDGGVLNNFGTVREITFDGRFVHITGDTMTGPLTITSPSSPYALDVTGNVRMLGNFYVSGTTTYVNSTNMNIKDNIILINSGETSAGVTLGQAGIMIDRGTLSAYTFMFHESGQTFRIGETGNTQAVATREDNPYNGGLAYWNSALSRFDVSSGLTSGLTFDNYWEITDGILTSLPNLTNFNVGQVLNYNGYFSDSTGTTILFSSNTSNNSIYNSKSSGILFSDNVNSLSYTYNTSIQNSSNVSLSAVTYSSILNSNGYGIFIKNSTNSSIENSYSTSISRSTYSSILNTIGSGTFIDDSISSVMLAVSSASISRSLYSSIIGATNLGSGSNNIDDSTGSTIFNSQGHKIKYSNQIISHNNQSGTVSASTNVMVSNDSLSQVNYSNNISTFNTANNNIVYSSWVTMSNCNSSTHIYYSNHINSSNNYSCTISGSSYVTLSDCYITFPINYSSYMFISSVDSGQVYNSTFSTMLGGYQNWMFYSTRSSMLAGNNGVLSATTSSVILGGDLNNIHGGSNNAITASQSSTMRGLQANIFKNNSMISTYNTTMNASGNINFGGNTSIASSDSLIDINGTSWNSVLLGTDYGTISGYSFAATLLALGHNNTIKSTGTNSNYNSTIFGGSYNVMYLNGSTDTTIFGGYNNLLSATTSYSTFLLSSSDSIVNVSNSQSNMNINSSNCTNIINDSKQTLIVNSKYSKIVGRNINQAFIISGDNNTISGVSSSSSNQVGMIGGSNNNITMSSDYTEHAIIIGSYYGKISGTTSECTILNAQQSEIISSPSDRITQGTILGGVSNNIYGNHGISLVYGYDNTISGYSYQTMILGGYWNRITGTNNNGKITNSVLLSTNQSNIIGYNIKQSGILLGDSNNLIGFDLFNTSLISSRSSSVRGESIRQSGILFSDYLTLSGTNIFNTTVISSYYSDIKADYIYSSAIIAGDNNIISGRTLTDVVIIGSNYGQLVSSGGMNHSGIYSSYYCTITGNTTGIINGGVIIGSDNSNIKTAGTIVQGGIYSAGYGIISGSVYNSAILGGHRNTISSSPDTVYNTVILGGTGITATISNTAYVQYFNLSGYQIYKISNDITLSNSSNTSLVTEYAVQRYVNSLSGSTGGSYATTITGNTVLTGFTITHSLGTKDVIVQTFIESTGTDYTGVINRNGINTVYIEFAFPPSATDYIRVVVQK